MLRQSATNSNQNQAKIYNLLPVNRPSQNNQIMAVENQQAPQENPEEENSKYVLTSKKKTKWLNEYNWLTITLTDRLVCKICEKYSTERSNTFVTVSTGYHNTFLKAHMVSSVHVKSVKAKIFKNHAEINPFTSSIKFTEEEDKVIPVFRNILFLAENCIAINKCENFHSYIQSLGVTITEHYRNPVIALEILTHYSNEISLDIFKQIEETKFIGLSFDESTDSAGESHLSLSIRFVKFGKVKHIFVSLFELKDKKGETLFKIIKSFLDDHKLLSKICCITMDGASNNMGPLIGFTSFFKRIKPDTVFVHCAAHVLALSLKHIVNSIPNTKYLYHIYKLLGSFFHSSSSKNKVLLADEDNDDELSIIKIFEIRWLSLYKCMNRVFEIYSSVIRTIEQFLDSDAVANALFGYLTNFKNLYYSAGIVDILFHLNVFNSRLQGEKLTIFQVNEYLKEVVDGIKLLFTENNNGFLIEGFYSGSIREAVLQNGEWEKIKIQGYSDSEFETAFSNLIKFKTQLLESLEARFIEFKLQKSFVIFDIEILKKLKISELKDYGHRELDNIVNFFNLELKYKPLIVKNLIEKEFYNLKYAIFNSLKTWSNERILLYIFENPEIYSCLAIIYEYIISMPITSVQDERNFSLMNLIKTPLRNLMVNSTLNSHMNIAGNIDNITFTKDELIFKTFGSWKKEKERLFIKTK